MSTTGMEWLGIVAVALVVTIAVIAWQAYVTKGAVREVRSYAQGRVTLRTEVDILTRQVKELQERVELLTKHSPHTQAALKRHAEAMSHGYGSMQEGPRPAVDRRKGGGGMAPRKLY